MDPELSSDKEPISSHYVGAGVIGQGKRLSTTPNQNSISSMDRGRPFGVKD